MKDGKVIKIETNACKCKHHMVMVPPYGYCWYCDKMKIKKLFNLKAITFTA